MGEAFWRIAAEFLRKQKNNRIWRNAMLCMASVVVFATTYALILPAITLELPGGKRRAAATSSDAYEDNREAASPSDATPSDATPSNATPSDAEELENDVLVLEQSIINSLEELDGNTYAVYSRPNDRVMDAREQGDGLGSSVPDGKMDGWLMLNDEEFGRLWTFEQDADGFLIWSQDGYLNLDADGAHLSEEPQELFVSLAGSRGHIRISSKEEEESRYLRYGEAAGDEGWYTTENAANPDTRLTLYQTSEETAEIAGEYSCELSCTGVDFVVEVTCDADAQIPAEAELAVREIEPGTDEYEIYYYQALRAMKEERGDAVSLSFARFFDISFLVGDEEIEPSAPVHIRVIYDEGIELGPADSGSAVHFAESGIEVLEAQTERDGEEVTAFTFTQTGFSVTGTVIGSESLVEDGDYIILAQDSDENYYAMDENGNAVLVSYDPETGVVACGDDSALWWTKTGNQLRNRSSQEYVCLDQDKQGIRAVSGGEALLRIESAGDGERTSIYSCSEESEEPVCYSLSLTETETEELIFSAEESDSEPAAVLMLAAYSETTEAGGSAQTLDSGGADIVYNLPDCLQDVDTANEWQIVSGEFEEQTTDYTIVADADGNLFRMQKKVAPAGTENEFYIYLDVEPVYYHDWKNVFLASGILINNANNNVTYNTDYAFTPDDTISSIKKGLGGVNSHSSMLVSADHAPLNGNYTDKTGFDIYIDTIELEISDGTYMTIADADLVYSLSQNSTGSFTIIYSAPNGNGCVKLSNIEWNGKGRGSRGSGGLLRFPQEAYKAMVDANKNNFDYMLQKSFPLQVTDQMGDFIQFLGVEYCSIGSYSLETAEGDGTENTVLIWKLDTNGDGIEDGLQTPSSDPDAYEQIEETTDAYAMERAFQLVYKIRLAVENEGFSSCADAMDAKTGDTIYRTNQDTTLNYEKEDGTEGTASFISPEVRGLLYDVVFKKTDENGNPLPGAVFRLYRKEIETDEDSGEQQAILTEAGAAITTGTEETAYRFSGLPWGTYVLKETPPDGYGGENQVEEWELQLCYTESAETLSQDMEPYQINMRWAGNDSLDEDGAVLPWTIKNVKKITEQGIVLKKVSMEDEGLPLAGAVFALYGSDAQGCQNPEPMEGYEALVSNEQGIFSPADFKLELGTYYLKEIKAPDGYNLFAEPVKLVVSEGQVLVRRGAGQQEFLADAGTAVCTVLLPNSSGVRLPETGGSGTNAMVMSGMLLMAGSLLYGCWKRKKQGRRFGI